MAAFGRVIRLALQYRFSAIAALLCALAVGVFWGANISVVYPFVEVIFQGKSFHDWIDDRIADCRQNQAEAEDVIRRAKVLFVDHVGTTGILRAARIAREAAIPVVGDIEGGAGAEYDELLQLVDHLIVSWPYACPLYPSPSPRDS